MQKARVHRYDVVCGGCADGVVWNACCAVKMQNGATRHCRPEANALGWQCCRLWQCTVCRLTVSCVGGRLLLSELAAWRRDDMHVRQLHVIFADGFHGLFVKLHVLE